MGLRVRLTYDSQYISTLESKHRIVVEMTFYSKKIICAARLEYLHMRPIICQNSNLKCQKAAEHVSDMWIPGWKICLILPTRSCDQ